MEAVPGGAHTIFDVLWGLLLAAGGFIVNGMRNDQKETEKRVGEIERTFATRGEVEAAVTRVEKAVERVEDKLDRVIERRYGPAN